MTEISLIFYWRAGADTTVLTTALRILSSILWRWLSSVKTERAGQGVFLLWERQEQNEQSTWANEEKVFLQCEWMQVILTINYHFFLSCSPARIKKLYDLLYLLICHEVFIFHNTCVFDIRHYLWALSPRDGSPQPMGPIWPDPCFLT